MNIPFELIFIILFFVLPILGSLQRRLRERSRNGSDTRTPERRPSPEASQPTTLTRADTTSSSGGQTEGWLEEAQRRVREARQEEATKRGRGGVNPRTLPQTPATTPAPTRTPPPIRPARATSLEGRTLEGRSLEVRPDFSRPENRLRNASGDANSAVSLDTAPPLRVQRLQGGGRATMGPRALRFDEPTLMTGIVWHQVLSPPLSKRRSRLSQRQR